MKKVLLSLFIFLFFYIQLQAQCSFTTNISAGGPTVACGSVALTAGNTGNIWTQKANFGNGVRYRGIAFSIGSKGYMGTGTGTTTYMSDFWEYDPSNNTWSQKANYAGGACYGAVGFSSSNKGYVGTGFNGTYKNDFYEYDPVNNVWSQKANFAGTARTSAVGFFVNGKCYIGTGSGATANFNDLWEYDPNTNFWTAKASIPSATRYLSFGTAVGSLAYVGAGYVNAVVSNDVWEYNSSTNTWTQKANLGTATLYGATAMGIGPNLFVAGGYEFSTSTYSDKMWIFNAGNNTWSQMQNIGSGQGRYSASSFAIGLRGYVVGGYTTTAMNSTWEFEAPGTYSWSTGYIGQVFTPSVSGTYSVLVTNASNCTATAVQAVSISPNPNLTVSGNALLCSGNSLTLSASGANSYTWSANAGGGNSNIVVVSPSVNTIYTVSGTTGTCSIDVPISTSVNPSPNAAIAASGPTLGCGSLNLINASNANSWTQMTGITGVRTYPIAFSIGSKAYAGLGYNGNTALYYNDFWEYDPGTGAWTQKANYGGGSRMQAVAFAIGTKGYVGSGYYGAYISDFWEYDPSSNTWVQKATFTGFARYGAVGFAIGNKGYFGTGYNGGVKSDFWEYDPAVNLWTQKATFTGGARTGAVGFAINNSGYISLGASSGYYNDLWEYNPGTNTWTQKTSFPGGGRSDAAAFSLANKAYIGTGNSGSGYQNDFWEYDQVSDTWLQRANVGGGIRFAAAGFSLLGKGYIGFGSTTTYTNDLWRFDPNYIQWSTSEQTPSITVSSSGLYTSTVTALNGCLVISSISVSLSPNPTITVVTPTLFCAGQTNTLSASGAGSYTWSANAGGALTNSVAVTPNTSIVYTVSGTSGTCSINYPVSINVMDTPTAVISVSGSSVGCGSVTLNTSSGGDVWTQKLGMNSGRRFAASFAIGTKGYIGTGSTTATMFMDDFWEYDAVNNAWTQKANFGGSPRNHATGFAIGNKGYIGTGYDGTLKADFWEYNPATNTWTQKANVIAGGRQAAVGMSIGSKGYIGLGTNGSFTYYNTFCEYNPLTDTWTYKSSFTGGARYGVACFSIGNKGYVSSGSGSTSYNDLWEYDPNTDVWTQKSSYAGGTRYFTSGFSIGNLGFVVAGYNGSTAYNDIWEYNSANNTWVQRNTGSFSARYGAQVFAIGAKAYITNGYSTTSPIFPNDLWQYTPINTLLWSNTSTLQTTAFNTSGTASLVVTNVVGCSASTSQNILLSPNPNVAVIVPSLMCSGQNNTITATGANTYTWSANAGSSNASSVSINPSTTTTYSVSGTTGSCTVVFPVVINVTTTPIASIAINGATLGCGPRILTAGIVTNTWVQKTSMSNYRSYPVNFVIANKAYVGTGNNGSYLNDFWSYDPVLNSWTQKANFPGTARYGASGFSVGNFGYVGTGYDGTYKNDFWQYNPLTNTWVQKANFPGSIRYCAVAFNIADKGYLGTGANNSGNFNDFWEYDPNTDAWTQKANVGGGLRALATGFAIGAKGYIGFGYVNSNVNDLWEYNPASDTWVQKASCPGIARQFVAGTSVYGRGFIGTGYGNSSTGLSDFWEFDPSSNTWAQRAALPGLSRYGATAFAINGKVFLGCGYNSGNGQLSDFWEYTPVSNYIWSNSVITATNQVINSGNYSVTVSNLGGCSASSVITLSLSLNPTITITGSNTACSGQSNTLLASGAGSYTWSANAGGGNSNFVVVSPTITTTYSITGATGSCSVTDPILVVPIVSPNASIAASGPTLGCGSLILSNANGGDVWVQKANIQGIRGNAVGFSINGKGYVGVGANSYSNDLWEFDPATNTWTQKANFIGTSRNSAFAFVVGSKAYVGGGTDNISDKNDVYEYNPLNNTWTQKADYPLATIANAAAFSIGNKGYVGTGRNGAYTTAFYEYDPSTDIWTQKANFGGTARYYAVGFSIGSKGYITTGMSNTPLYNTDLWEYDPGTNTWTQKANFGGGARAWAAGFTLGNYGFVSGGANGTNFYNDLWEYNPISNAWVQRASHSGVGRYYLIALAIGGKGYIGTGYNNNVGSYLNDFYEYTPINTYTWSTGVNTNSINVSTSNTYSLSMTSLVGCVSNSIQSIALSPNPTLSVLGNTAVLCAGIPYTLQVSGAGSYTWSANAANSNSNVVIVTPTVSTVYTVTGATGSCAVNVPVQINVNPTADASILFSGSTCGSAVSLSTTSGPGNTWTQKTSFTNARELPVAMVINNKAYFGTGWNTSNYYTDMWEYNPSTNAWTQKANFAGTARMGAAAFSINGKGYVGTGYDLTNTYKADFWEFDPIANTWTQKANYSGTARYSGVGFAIGSKGYIGTGYNGGSSYNDLYEYDPSTNAWTYKNSFSSTGRNQAIAFVTNNFGYIGLGVSGSTYLSDLWQYNPTSNTFTQKANIGGSARYGSAAFSISDRGFVGTGQVNGVGASTELWEYNSTLNTWTQRANLTGVARQSAIGFAVNNKGYIAGGRDASFNELSDIYEYSPANTFSWSTGSTLQAISVSSSGSYSVTTNNIFGCGSSATQSITIGTNPTLTISGPSLACAGSALTLNVSGANGYTWSANAGGSSASVIVVNPTASQVYTVIGANGACTTTATKTITINALPIVGAIASSTSVCAGNTVNLTAYGAATYTWSNGVVNNSTFVPTVSNTYTISGTDFNGCSNSNLITVNVNPVPIITVNNGTVCQGQSFTITPGGASTYTYSGASAVVTPTINTSYSVTGTSTAGCVSATPAVVNVIVLPTPTLAVSSGSICNGQTFTFNPSGAVSYSYSGGGSSVVSPSISTVYLITGTASNGCSSNVNGTVTVVGLPSISAPSGSICAGSSFTINPTGASNYTYSSGSSVVSPSTTTTYSIFGSNVSGCSNATAALVTVTVNAIPVITVNSGTICQGVTFVISPSGASSYTYSSVIPIVSPTTSSNYSVIGTSSAGCVSAAAAISTVNVLTSPTLAVSGGSICNGQSFTFNPSGATTYSFSGASAVVSPTSNTTYTITGSAANGCTNFIPAVATVTVVGLPNISAPSGSICAGSSFTINPTGANSYTYSTGTNVVSPGSTNTYSVYGSNASGCINTSPALVTVTVNAIPVITVNSGTICQGLSFTMIPGGASTYTYSSGSAIVSPTSTINYSVTGTSGAGCVSAAAAIATVNVLTSPTLAVSGGSICNGQSFTFNPSGATTYSYSSGSGVVSPTSNATYTITGTAANGCNNFIPALATVTVVGLPSISAPSGSICAGSSYTINPTGGSTYSYSSGSSVVSPSATTTYSLFGTGVSGCSNATAALVTVTVNAIPVITVNNGTICQGQSFTMVPGGASTYTYSSGSAIVSPTSTINYSVTGTSSAGCLSASAAVSALNVLISPTLAVSGGSICAGQVFTFNPSGASSYTYSGGSSTVSPVSNTTYTITGTAANGCNNFIPALATVTVVGLPNVSAPNGSICLGSSYVINPSGAINYTYSSGSNTVSPTVTSTYSVYGNNVSGCVNTFPAIVTVTVNTIPVITVNSGTICQGQSFTMAPGGASTYTYSSGSSIVSPTSTINYSVTGTSSAGCVSTSAAVSAVNVLISPTIAVAGGSICAGQVFTIVPSGASSYTYSGGASTVSPVSNTTYTITGTALNGCRNFIPALATVTVNALPIITVPNGSICIGSSYTINPSASGGGAVSYTYSGGSAVVNPSTTTSYSVTGTSSMGCVSASPAVFNLTVNAIPIISVNSGSICQGQTFTLNPSGASTYTYSGSSALVTPSVNTSYSVSGTSSAGCVSTVMAISSVSVSAAPIISANSGTTCAGTSFTIIPNGALSYTYSGGAAVVSPSISTNYSVTGTNSLGCVSLSPAIAGITVYALPIISAPSGSVCRGNSYTINPSGAATYTYSSGSSVVSPTITSNYSVTGTSSMGCLSASSSTLQVSVMSLPTISLPATAIICDGAIYTITPSGAVNYTYSSGSAIVSPSVSASYTVYGASSQGCIGNAVITISVQPGLTLSINGPTVTCEGQSITLFGNGANTYTWSNGNTGATVVISPTSSTVYSVTGGSGNCTGTASQSLFVNANPTVNAIGSATTICADESVTLTASGANTYTWSNSITGSSISITPSITTTFTVIGEDLNGCTNSAVFIQNVDDCTSLTSGKTIEGLVVKVYPNPGYGLVKVEFNTVLQKAEIEIYDYLGRLVLTEEANALNNEFNFSRMANGLYTLRVLSNENEVFRQKLIKQ